MTGLMTTISVSGMTNDKIQMLNTLNDDITIKTSNIVTEAGKISQSLEDCHCKIRGLRIDLQASNKKSL
ncbi:hypothetical protein DPMN_012834 [Dreissena polymorpha]|uniref:Uncharacterized protein n=1 Tax=Dreissena polymorpha TaxID=45954 RepID=A0A9D4S1A6_DREPO|nr:hypothetical protein DPMN_012834 [Dreissena polymorpha]